MSAPREERRGIDEHRKRLEQPAATDGRAGRSGSGAVARPARAGVASQADRPQRDPRRRRGGQRRVHPVPVHRLEGRPGLPVGRRRGSGRCSSSSTWRSSATRWRPGRPRSPASSGCGSRGASCSCSWRLLATIWPGWATSAATVATFAVRRRRPQRRSRSRALLAIGVALTASPVVYQTVERLQFLKVGALLLFVVIALFAAVSGTAYSDLSETVTSFGTFPSEIDLAILVGALAAAGAGGANNLVQSNWIRDKGFGMGRYAPRIVSPITGEEEAVAVRAALRVPRRREEHVALARVVAAGQPRAVRLVRRSSRSCRSRVFSLIAYSTVFGNPDLPDESGFDFISLEADALDAAGRQLVRHAVPGDRRGQPVRRGARHRRLRLASGRRRDPVRLHRGQPPLDREPPLLHRRVDDGDRRQPHPAAGLRSAARAGDDLDGAGRVHHVRLLVTCWW